MSTKEAAAYSGDAVSEQTLANWRFKKKPGGPPWVRFGRKIMYEIEAFDAWLKSCVVEPPPAEPAMTEPLVALPANEPRRGPGRPRKVPLALPADATKVSPAPHGVVVPK